MPLTTKSFSARDIQSNAPHYRLWLKQANALTNVLARYPSGHKNWKQAKELLYKLRDIQRSK